MQGRLTETKSSKIQFFPKNNWEKEFKIASKNKINLIEWTIDYHNIKKNPIFCDTKKISNISKKYKIKIESVTCDFLMQKPFYKKKYINSKSLFFLDKLIDSCKQLNIKYIIFPLVDNGSLKSTFEKKELIFGLKKIENKLSKKINILFESDFKPKKLLNFISNFNFNKFGINYDTGNSACYGYSIISEFNSYFKYIKNIHIKDRKINSSTVLLGKGNFDFKTFFYLIKKNKYKQNLILQTVRSKSNQLNMLKYNLEFINNYF